MLFIMTCSVVYLLVSYLELQRLLNKEEASRSARVFNNRSSVRLPAYQLEECVVENSTLVMASMRETNVVRGVIEVIDRIPS